MDNWKLTFPQDDLSSFTWAATFSDSIISAKPHVQFLHGLLFFTSPDEFGFPSKFSENFILLWNTRR